MEITMVELDIWHICFIKSLCKSNEKLIDIERFQYLTSEFSNCMEDFKRLIQGFYFYITIYNITQKKIQVFHWIHCVVFSEFINWAINQVCVLKFLLNLAKHWKVIVFLSKKLDTCMYVDKWEIFIYHEHLC